MKQFKGSVIAALVLVLVLGAIYLLEVRGRGGGGGERALPGFEAAEVVSLELRYPKAAFRFKKSGGDGADGSPMWEVLRALPADGKLNKWYPADEDVLSSILDALSQMKVDKVASSKEPGGQEGQEGREGIESFGLARPAVTLTLNIAGGKSLTVYVGSDTPTGSGTYVSVGGDARVLITNASSVYPLMNHTVNDLREKRLLDLPLSKINRVEFRYPAGSFAIVREGELWKPGRLEGGVSLDQFSVKNALNDLANLKADRFIDDEPRDLSRYGLDRPALEVSLDSSKLHNVVQFGGKAGRQRYLKIAGKEPVFSITNFVFERLPRNIDDLRSRSLVDFKTDNVSALEISSATGYAKYIKSGGKWKEQAMSGSKGRISDVAAALGAIKRLRIEEFVSDAPEEIASYGLGSGAWVIAVTTPARKIKILLGKEERRGKEGRVYAKLAGEDPVYMVSNEILSELGLSAGKGREPAP